MNAMSKIEKMMITGAYYCPQERCFVQPSPDWTCKLCGKSHPLINAAGGIEGLLTALLDLADKVNELEALIACGEADAGSEG